MFFDDLVTDSHRDDGLDGVRVAALGRGRVLVGLLAREREAHAALPADWHGRAGHEASLGRIRVEIGSWLAAALDEDGRAAAVCLMLAASFGADGFWDYDAEIDGLMKRLDGWSGDEAAVLLLRACEYDMDHWFARGLSAALGAVERLDADGRAAVAPWLRHAQAHLAKGQVGARERRSLTKRLTGLLGEADEAVVPAGLIPAHAPWAAPLRERAESAPSRGLAHLVQHLAALAGPRPTQRWRRTCVEAVDAAAARGTVAEMLEALAEGDPLCSREAGAGTAWIGDGYHYHYLAHDRDTDLARGAVWAAALTETPATVRQLGALALRAGGPGSGMREDLKLAGAAINALAEVEDPAALEELWRLGSRIKHRALRKQLDTAVVTAAGRQGITPEQLVERSVPRHGLAADGSLERGLGGHRVRLAIEDAATVRLTFTHPDGRTSRTAPAALKDGHPEELADLRSLAKAVRSTLSGERARVEALMSAGREWPYDEWCAHYRDHPVTGVLVRGLILEYRDAAGDWHAVAPGAVPPGEPARVRLWHPVRASVEEIGRWRERMVVDRLRQPFKQAFREIYLLTPAEERTRGYSNRYAAHIVHYQRLYALFKERGWQSNYLGSYDGGYDGRARGEFGDGRWRACFHHEPVPGDHGHYSPDHAATDQVRFERRSGRRWQEVPLAEVPPLVFSEAMRDVDLFVAVTSIAADPDWTDRGPRRAYWERAGFAELTGSAESRRDALSRILPRLKIADRCTLHGRFLVVRGDLRTYRIHLGSANILMEPDDSYLCIVPSGRTGTGKAFLPFEDDRLSLILSKAFLLAADRAITDETILAQLARGA
ncbi:DUF4132 domain-containing protein [Streptomyces sp. NPDC006458]|uniref:DUF4132 domain-containing protein n=1 Tax=Streptomyces sp. NPDC006458 TaxID=3154302 RepID=UPI0033B481E4